MPRVLHLLSQRPGLTGSGVTLDATVRHARAAGWEQAVVVGTPVEEPRPAVGGLPPDAVHPLLFGRDPLPFAVPGMSDVMPYPSTRFAAMTADQLAAYRAAWRDHLAAVVGRFRPDLLHTHHLWLLSALVKDVAPDLPVVTQCHGTGLRQLALCPHLAAEVRAGCARNERLLVLHRGQRAEACSCLGLAPERVRVVGAGYRDDLFHPRGREPDAGRRLLYVGKLSAAKGLPQLLDAFARLEAGRPGLELHVAGAGGGGEAAELDRRMRAMAPAVTVHGQLDQGALARLMRRSALCVLPSFYEGVPLVLVEAAACGCRLVATRLPGVEEELAPALGALLDLVDLPPMATVDRPRGDGLPVFVATLAGAIGRALERGPVGGGDSELGAALAPFTWAAVFGRVAAVWRELLGGSSGRGRETAADRSAALTAAGAAARGRGGR